LNKGKFINGWTIAIFLLVVIIIAGSVIIWQKNSRYRGIEISVTPAREMEGHIWVGGAVNNPGLYPFYKDDNIQDVIRAAGGLKDGADSDSVKFSIVVEDENETPQKININTAEAWLLEALPGVGEVRALAIIEYRCQHGPFRDIYELVKVPGFGDESFKHIEGLITVKD
jgi:competence protein ComEA